MNHVKRNTLLRNRNLVLGAIILLLVILVIVPQFRNKKSEETPVPGYERINGQIYIPEGSPIRENIKVERVKLEAIRGEVSAPASVEANPSKRANIYPPAGGRIVRLFVNMGQSVKTGQSLFEIYSPEIADVQTGYLSARSALAQAERDLHRKESLHEKGIASLRELEETRTLYEIAQSETMGALLKMKIMGVSEEDIGNPVIVGSPINGSVIALSVASGEFIATPEEPLMIIADLSSVWVTASIQEKDLRFVQAGAEASARFAAYPGEEYRGKVLFVNDILDEATRTTKVRIEFENDKIKLKPGMFASVKFHTQPAPSILLPAKAVLQRRDFNYVFVQVKPNTYEMRIVQTGLKVDDNLVIIAGLEEGEEVIVQNAILLQ
jgi:cobalt-zinc-cadmium efflux system membrane fusion protein